MDIYPLNYECVNGVLFISDDCSSVQIQKSNILSIYCQERVHESEWRVIIEMTDGTKYDFGFFDLDNEKMLERAIEFFQFCSS